MLLNGSEILVECLKEQGVDTVFGYPGGAVLNIYDALYKHQNEIKHYLTSHEQGAAHAADGYARATGKVGVCIATRGPGACNLVTGIATAYMDSIPMVAITLIIITIPVTISIFFKIFNQLFFFSIFKKLLSILYIKYTDIKKNFLYLIFLRCLLSFALNYVA